MHRGISILSVDMIQGYTLVKLGEETHASHHGRRPHKSSNTIPFLSHVLHFPAFSDQGATKDAEGFPSLHELPGLEVALQNA
jgi:hypothetical protein